MKLIIGLGNPEEKFSSTRHNVGFIFVDQLREYFQYQTEFTVSDWRTEDTFQSEMSFLKSGSQIVGIFQKPQTYMNKSGEAVAKVVKKFDIDPSSELILIHDDLDIPLGKFKVQVEKSPVGHNGVKNVEDRLGNANFKRLRIGIENRENKNIPGEDYVLMKFTDEEQLVLNEVITDAQKSILAEILL